MSSQRVDRIEGVVGSRILYRDGEYSNAAPSEAAVVELAPSGRWVRLRSAGNPDRPFWRDVREVWVVEVLGGRTVSLESPQ